MNGTKENSQSKAPKISPKYLSFLPTFFKVWKLTLQALRIRAINDRFRQSGEGGETFVSRGVQALPPEEQEQLFEKVRAHKDFKKEDDPCGEHDLGSIMQNGVEYCWMINCYNNDFSGASGDPCDAEQTQRILAIMQMREFGRNWYNVNDPLFLRNFAMLSKDR